MFGQQRLRLFLGGSDLGGVGREVDVSLLLDPGQGLLGGALEEAVLLILV